MKTKREASEQQQKQASGFRALPFVSQISVALALSFLFRYRELFECTPKMDANEWSATEQWEN
jgi:hypothetical protein